MILDDESEMYQKVKSYLLGKKCVYIPYLGKNDHIANIDEVEEISLDKKLENIRLSSLFIEKNCDILGTKPRGEFSFFFKEFSPMSLQKEFHFYEYENLVFTNHRIASSDYESIYAYDKQNYFFF